MNANTQANTQIRVEIVLGTLRGAGDSVYSRKGEPNTPECVNAIITILHERISAITGGATILRGEGSWHNDNGTLVREPNIIVSTIAENTPSVIWELRLVAAYAKGYLSQDSVLFAVHPVTSVEFL